MQVKTYNGRNRFVIPFIVRMSVLSNCYLRLSSLIFPSPYYIWLGRSRSCDVSRFCHAFEVEGGNMLGNCSPASFTTIKDSETIPPLEIGEPALNTQVSHADALITVTPPLSSFHYHLGKVSQHIMKFAMKLTMD
jgi:betaine lipid synthase